MANRTKPMVGVIGVGSPSVNPETKYTPVYDAYDGSSPKSFHLFSGAKSFMENRGLVYESDLLIICPHHALFALEDANEGDVCKGMNENNPDIIRDSLVRSLNLRLLDAEPLQYTVVILPEHRPNDRFSLSVWEDWLGGFLTIPRALPIARTSGAGGQDCLFSSYPDILNKYNSQAPILISSNPSHRFCGAWQRYNQPGVDKALEDQLMQEIEAISISDFKILVKKDPEKLKLLSSLPFNAARPEPEPSAFMDGLSVNYLFRTKRGTEFGLDISLNDVHLVLLPYIDKTETLCADIVKNYIAQRNSFQNEVSKKRFFDGANEAGHSKPRTKKCQFEFMRQGEYWLITYEGKVFQVKHRKGMDYIAQMLDKPHKEFRIPELEPSYSHFGEDIGRFGATKSITSPSSADYDRNDVVFDSESVLDDRDEWDASYSAEKAEESGNVDSQAMGAREDFLIYEAEVKRLEQLIDKTADSEAKRRLVDELEGAKKAKNVIGYRDAVGKIHLLSQVEKSAVQAFKTIHANITNAIKAIGNAAPDKASSKKIMGHLRASLRPHKHVFGYQSSIIWRVKRFA